MKFQSKILQSCFIAFAVVLSDSLINVMSAVGFESFNWGQFEKIAETSLHIKLFVLQSIVIQVVAFFANSVLRSLRMV